MEELDGWVWTYTHSNKLFSGAKREDYSEIFNNFNSDKVIRSKELDTLIELIIKSKGDKSKINFVD